MGIRRRSRELALQALFYMDARRDPSPENLDLFCRNYHPSQKALPFFLALVRGVLEHQGGIDRVIERYSSHWKIGRMPVVDRNVLRVAVYELLFCGEIPPKVTINEAIDVGKKYGSEDSGAFINGILDSIRLALERNEIEVDAGPPPVPGATPGETHGDEKDPSDRR